MSNKKQKKATKPVTNNLQHKFLELSPRDQMGVTNFFNLHNAAHFVYDGLSEEAQQYVSYCIRLSQQATKVEEKETHLDEFETCTDDSRISAHVS